MEKTCRTGQIPSPQDFRENQTSAVDLPCGGAASEMAGAAVSLCARWEEKEMALVDCPPLVWL